MTRLVFYLLVLLGATSCKSVQLNSFSTHNKNKASLHAKLLKQATLVVVVDEENNPLDEQLQPYMEKHWDYCHVKFITPSEVRNYLRPKNYVLTFSKSYVTTPSGMGYPGFVIYSGKQGIQYISDADVLTFVPAPHLVNKTDSMSPLLEEPEFFIKMYIDRLERQLVDLSAEKKIVVKNAPEPGTVFFNGQKKVSSGITVAVREEMIPDEKLAELARSLGVTPDNIEVMSLEKMSRLALANTENMLFIFEQQYNQFTNGVGTGFYVYDARGNTVAATSVLTPAERKELANQRIVRFLSFTLGPIVTAATVVFYGAYYYFILTI